MCFRFVLTAAGIVEKWNGLGLLRDYSEIVMLLGTSIYIRRLEQKLLAWTDRLKQSLRAIVAR